MRLEAGWMTGGQVWARRLSMGIKKAAPGGPPILPVPLYAGRTLTALRRLLFFGSGSVSNVTC